jgi:hypothetical protein
MDTYPYILFNKTLEQCRRLGARGGRAHAHNQRARRALPGVTAAVPCAMQAPEETVAEAIALLDAQFPWLRGAEERRLHRRRDMGALGQPGKPPGDSSASR